LFQGVARAKENDRRLTDHTVAALDQIQASIQSGGSPQFTPIKPTGEPANDATVELMNYMMTDVFGNLGGMFKEKEALDPQDIFAVKLIADRAGMQSEVAKRTQWLGIIENHRQRLESVEQRCVAQCGSLKLSEDLKRATIRGLHDGISPVIKKYGQNFDLLVRQAQAEQALLRFLISSFEGYKIKEETIYFATEENTASYNRLAQAVADATKALVALQKAEVEASEKEKDKLRKVGQ
jgi:hypothetical protein